MNCKQVLIIRKDLKMRKGKMVAQGAHASMKAILDAGSTDVDQYEDTVCSFHLTPVLKSWLTGIFTKICVGVDSEAELLEVYARAKASGMLCSLIQDSGLTEFDNVPTYTAVAVGPAEAKDIDKITGSLKLL